MQRQTQMMDWKGTGAAFYKYGPIINVFMNSIENEFAQL